jgi:hypothetical protein
VTTPLRPDDVDELVADVALPPDPPPPLMVPEGAVVRDGVGVGVPLRDGVGVGVGVLLLVGVGVGVGVPLLEGDGEGESDRTARTVARAT